MKYLVLTLVMVMSAGAAAQQAGDFYVAPRGDDKASGKVDAPFATIARAQEAARAARGGKADSAKTIVVRGGNYELDRPLTFTVEDSNTTIAALAGETPVFSGGRRITGWKINERGWWVVNLPEVSSGQWSFVQLFVDGQRRPRPRLPKEGYSNIADAAEATAKNKGKGYDRFSFAAGNIRPDWHNLNDVEVLAMQIWAMARLRIESVDEANRLVTFTGKTSHNDAWAHLAKGRRFIVENVREALEKPGEWYLDRKSGELTYIPKPGEDPSTTVVIAPRVQTLVQVAGDPANKKFVEKLTLRGLSFVHGNWSTPAEGNVYAQAEANQGGAISMTGARDCVIEKCSVKSVGIYAIDIGAACQRNRVESCELSDLGAGGIKIGETRLVKDPDLLTSHTVIRNNVIAHGGRLHPAAIGVWIGQSPHNTVEHNDIYDFYYTGVSVGWSWGYHEAASHHNTVAWNHIHKIGQGVLSDMGGIYTLGLAPGSVLHHNLIHDVHAFDYGGWGIYFDEGTTGMTAENNIVYDVKTGGFHQHYGRDNIVRNNIFAFSKVQQLQRSRQEAHRSFTFERNIVYWNSGTLLGSHWGDDKFAMDWNLYWRSDGKPFDFAGQTFEKWKEKGMDRNSIIADPMFEEPAKGNFKMKAGSAAEKIKFQPIDSGEVGAKGVLKPSPVPAAFPKIQ
jgi:hypothetical protein